MQQSVAFGEIVLQKSKVASAVAEDCSLNRQNGPIRENLTELRVASPRYD